MSKITYFIKKKIGKTIHSFSVEGDTLHDVVMAGRRLSFNDVNRCGLCGSDNLELTGHVAKNKFKYTLVKCQSCRGYINFGVKMKQPDICYLRTRTEKNLKTGKETKVLDWQAANIPIESVNDPF